MINAQSKDSEVTFVRRVTICLHDEYNRPVSKVLHNCVLTPFDPESAGSVEHSPYFVPDGEHIEYLDLEDHEDCEQYDTAIQV